MEQIDNYVPEEWPPVMKCLKANFSYSVIPLVHYFIFYGVSTTCTPSGLVWYINSANDIQALWTLYACTHLSLCMYNIYNTYNS